MDSVDGQWARRYGWMWLLLACGGRAGLGEGEVTHRSNGGVPNAVPSTIAGRLPDSGTGSGAAATGGAIGASSASGVRIVALGGVGASERHGRQPCGNLKIEPGEECDDGNVTAGDGCSPTCKLEPMGCPTNRCVLAEVCGDGRLGTRESCDDGNMTAGDGCGSECNAIEPGWICPWPGQACFTLCGDAIVAGAETCDQGNRNGVFVGSTTGCSHECRTVPVCSTALRHRVQTRVWTRPLV